MNIQPPNFNNEDRQNAGAPGKGKKPFDLGERTFEFAKRILDVCGKLPNKPECWNIRSQLSTAGTSAAANYEEGNGALTMKERRKSFGVARREARETRLWLRLIAGRYLPEKELQADIQEASEPIKIFSAIISELDQVK